MGISAPLTSILGRAPDNPCDMDWSRPTLIATLALHLGACGNGTPMVAHRYAIRPPPKTTKQPANMPSLKPPGDPNDISKNPFVVWVKTAYPVEASTIITRYLSKDGKPDPDRELLRGQAVTQVTTELTKQVSISLPKGLQAKKTGPNVVVTGVTDYQGYKITIRFEFRVRLLDSGLVKIDVPISAVFASSANDSLLVELFGGDLRAKAFAEILKNLDREGPLNASRTPGLNYYKGGVFMINPGLAFVTMPTTP